MKSSADRTYAGHGRIATLAGLCCVLSISSCAWNERGSWALARDLVVGGVCWFFSWDCDWGEPTVEEKRAKERLSQRLSVEGFERRLRDTRECEDCALMHAELAGVDLRSARLKGADLHGNFQGANLRGADLTGASLGGDFSGADFRGAKVEHVHLGDSKLIGARFDGLDLRRVLGADGVDWSGAILRDTNLEDVSFHGLYGPYHRTVPDHLLEAAWGGALLNHADLRGANLRSAVIAHCDLRGADLRGADLTGATMPDADDLRDAQLNGAIAPDGRRCAEGSVGRCIPEPKAARNQRRRGKN